VKYAYVADIQSLHKPQNETFLKNLLEKHGHFDAVFSNAALHWCNKDPAGVLESAKKVLKTDGRFIAEFGGWGNCIGWSRVL
jgi:SAM-dependent methyltransferase